MRRTIGLGLVFAIGVLALAASACGGGGETVTPTVAPTFTPSAVMPIPTATVPAAGGDLARGQAAFVRSCGGCHTVAGVSQGPVGPELTHIGTVASTRKPGMGAEAYIRESIDAPGAVVVEGYVNMMPPLAAALGGDYEAVVAYLLSLK